MRKEDIRLDEVLARGTLGGPHYDEILERVLERTAASEPASARRRVGRWAWVPAVALVPALALWVVHRSSDSSFRSKGVAAPAAGAVDISCGPSRERECRVGDVLVFTVNAAVVAGYLGAFAECLDSPGCDRIWYFSDSTTAAPHVVPGSGTVVVPQGVRIGAEHRPGRYRITTWIASRPLARGEVDSVSHEVLRSRSVLDFKVVP